MLPALGPLLSMIMVIRNIPWIWKLIRNWASIKQVVDNTALIFKSARDNGGLPTCEDSKKILENIEILFKNGLIDLDGLDETQFAEFIRELNGNIVCAIDDGRRFKKS